MKTQNHKWVSPKPMWALIPTIVCILSLPSGIRAEMKFRHHFIDRELPGSSWGQTAVGDLDRDGRMDYVTARSQGEIRWYRMESANRWSMHRLGENSPSDVGGALLDVDGDQWLDFIAGGAWYRNPANPRPELFERIVFDKDLNKVHDLMLADIDGDKRMDVLTMSDRNNLRWYRIPQDPKQPWERHDIGPSVHAGIGVGDIDGDGDIDIARSNLWYENADGKGLRWTVHENIPFGNPAQPYPNATHCVILDLDRDGDNDLIMTENEIKGGRIGWLENVDRKGGKWQLHEMPVGDKSIRGAYHSLLAADFDNDGDVDIFTCEMEGIPGDRAPRWFVWENRDGKGGQFVERVVLDANLGGHVAVTADFDGDGDLDIGSKLWQPRKDNANGGKNHVDYLENLTIDHLRDSAQIQPQAEHKARLLVLTDISNEPDDEESMVRLLVYANEFDLEGLIATTSTWLRNTTRVDLIKRQLGAYGTVRANLLKHAPGFPSEEHLQEMVKAGQPAFGMAGIGDRMNTAGSRHILIAADKMDDRPLWISVWGGANTLAQALWDARRERPSHELKRLVSKLRVYSISDQDDAGPWLRREFPDLFYIVSPSPANEKEYHKATWTGISGDRFYRNSPGHMFYLVDNPWLEANIIKGHGPLGELYPRLTYIMEGDTPSWFGLINRGLGWQESPSYGGWGGRYVLYQCYGETRPIWTNNRDSRDSVTTDSGLTVCSDQATIWRWREHYQHDFAARMDWCMADDFKKANHNPIAVLNGNPALSVLNIKAKSEEALTLSARGSSDPDGHTVQYRWFIYPEAGTYRGETTIKSSGETVQWVAPLVSKLETVHIILQVSDNGTPPLCSYRRAVISINP